MSKQRTLRRTKHAGMLTCVANHSDMAKLLHSFTRTTHVRCPHGRSETALAPFRDFRCVREPEQETCAFSAHLQPIYSKPHTRSYIVDVPIHLFSFRSRHSFPRETAYTTEKAPSTSTHWAGKACQGKNTRM